MGRLAGFKYRAIVRRLKKLGFEFDRQAAGSHEIMTELHPDLYIASMGRSGSTLIANWLSMPAENQYIFVEPNLAQGGSQLLQTLLERFGLPAYGVDSGSLEEFAVGMAGRRWGVKEVKGRLHDQLGVSIRPRCIVITVRDIGEVYLSLVEKHRVQGLEERFDTSWSANYCRRESGYLYHMSRSHPEYHVVRYHEFVASQAVRNNLSDVTGFSGGGVVDLNFDLYNRTHESGLYAGRIAPRPQSYRTITDRDIHAARELAAECAPYQTHFGYA